MSVESFSYAEPLWPGLVPNQLLGWLGAVRLPIIWVEDNRRRVTGDEATFNLMPSTIKSVLQEDVNLCRTLFDRKSTSFNPRRHKGGGQTDHPLSMFLALNFCPLTDYQKLYYNCSLFVNTSFDPN